MRCMRVRVLLFALLPGLLAAQSLQDFEKKVTQFTLSNGMTFLVIERHDAPVVSFHTYANVGAVDDPKGRTGLAHMFEHMAFKGTSNIGTKNWTLEKKALDAIETASILSGAFCGTVVIPNSTVSTPLTLRSSSLPAS